MHKISLLTSLHFAIIEGIRDNTKLLLENDAKCYLKGIYRRYKYEVLSPLELAQGYNYTKEILAILRAADEERQAFSDLLLAAIDSEDLDELGNFTTEDFDEITSRQGDFALGHAVLTEKYMALTFMLKAGANPNTADHKKRTPLMLAAQKKNLGMLELLTKHGAKGDLLDEKKKSATDYAIKAESEECFNFLLDSTQFASTKQIFEWIKEDKLDFIRKLSRECLEKRDFYLYTPLVDAILSSKLELFNL